jgi:hypothetical protein
MALPVHSVTYNASALTDITGTVIDRIVRGGPDEPATVRGQDRVLAGAEGMWPGNRVKQSRQIELFGWVTGSGATVSDQVGDYWDNRIALGTLFDPTVTATLSVLFQNGDTHTIDARTVSVSYNQTAPMMAEVSIVLESIDPDWA